MERLIRITWRAFWVGLGASAVLITQSLGPASPQFGPPPVPSAVVPVVPAAPRVDVPRVEAPSLSQRAAHRNPRS